MFTLSPKGIPTMTRLNEATLARMRQQFAQFLPDTCLIERPTRVADGGGGWLENWVLVSGGTVKCRLDPLYSRAQSETVAAQTAFQSDYVLTVPFDAPLTSENRVVLNGVAYRVRWLVSDHSWRVGKRAYVSRMD